MSQPAPIGLQEALHEWYGEYGRDGLAVADLTTMLESRPERNAVTDLLPVDEFQERLDLAKKFAKLREQDTGHLYQMSSAYFLHS